MTRNIRDAIIRILVRIRAVEISVIDESCSTWHESNELKDFDALFRHWNVQGSDDIRLKPRVSMDAEEDDDLEHYR